MKRILKYKPILAAAVLSAALCACDNDSDLVYIDNIDDITLNSGAGDIVLSQDAADALVLTVYWNSNGRISLSDPRVAAPVNALTNVMEFSSTDDFARTATVQLEAGECERQFTCRELNAIVSQLELTPGVKSPLYIRIASTLAANMPVVYSDVLSLSVTPFEVDTRSAIYLDSSKNDTGKTLYSPDNNHVYRGFIGAGSWENWWLLEGDGHTWGNDGVTGTPFMISSDASAWNMWYPGLGGCYYTVVNVPGSEWTALLVQTLTVSGDLSGDMSYDRKTNTWTMTINAAAAGDMNVTVSGTGKQYDQHTGTDDSAARDVTVGFSGDASVLGFNPDGAGEAVTVSVPAGESVLVLDLNDPAAWRLSAGGDAPAPGDEVAPSLWLAGHDDGLTQSDWTFAELLRLYNEDDKTYGGCVNFNSLWGYRIYPSNDWNPYYTMVEGGNATEGKLVADGEGNIEAPAAGLYVLDVSLSNMTYKTIAVTSVGVSGINNSWDAILPMTPTGTPGEYTFTYEKTASSEWGVKVIVNDNWDLCFGRGADKAEHRLYLYQEGFYGDEEMPDGSTVTLTVNLIDGTYNYSK